MNPTPVTRTAGAKSGGQLAADGAAKAAGKAALVDDVAGQRTSGGPSADASVREGESRASQPDGGQLADGGRQADASQPAAQHDEPQSGRPAVGLVAFVGAGPGDAGLLTVRAASLLARADLVVAAPRLSERVGHLLRPGSTVVDPQELAQDSRLLVKTARSGQLAVRLFSGDPFMFANAAADAAACAKAKVPFEIVPGVSAATAVPAYAGIPLTSDATGDVRIIQAAEVGRITVGPGTLVILGAETGITDIAKMLIAAGWPDATPFAIIWNGTTTDQHTVVGALGTVAADLKAAGVSLLTADGPAVAVVGEGVRAQSALSWFETKPLFGWRVLVPRRKKKSMER